MLISKLIVKNIEIKIESINKAQDFVTNLMFSPLWLKKYMPIKLLFCRVLRRLLLICNTDSSRLCTTAYVLLVHIKIINMKLTLSVFCAFTTKPLNWFLLNLVRGKLDKNIHSVANCNVMSEIEVGNLYG